jgi:hypothetical protein
MLSATPSMSWEEIVQAMDAEAAKGAGGARALQEDGRTNGETQ